MLHTAKGDMKAATPNVGSVRNSVIRTKISLQAQRTAAFAAAVQNAIPAS